MRDHSDLGIGAPVLHTTQFEYDPFGNRTKVTDDKGRVTDFAFDGRDRLVTVTQQGGGDTPNLPTPLVTAFEYDAASNVTKVTDPKAQMTIYGYDLLSRLRLVQQHEGEQVGYDYDERGRLAKVTNARGQALLYFPFAWGGIERVVHDLANDGEDAGDRKVSYTHDANGNVTSTRDTDFLTSAPASGGLPAGRLESFTHDALDRVDTATAHYIAGEPVLAAGYDRFGNRDALMLGDGSGTRVHQWAYDRQGRLVAACLPQGQATPPVACTPGGATQTLGFTPLPNDQLASMTHGNGLVSAYTYEPFGPIATITVGSSPLPLRLEYGYDELRNVTTIAETQNGTEVEPDFGFQYDAVYRLIEADYPDDLDLPPAPGESFGYDRAGNRDDDPANPSPWDYNDNNQLVTSPDVELHCYDADGNLTGTRAAPDTCASGTDIRSFTWDAQSRLLGFSEGSTSASYAYDPFGRRIRKTAGGATIFYLWDGDRLLAEYDGSGSRLVRYAYAGGFAPVQVAYAGSPETIYDVHSDHLDTPRMLTDDAGLPSWRAAYEAFGGAHVSSDPDGSIVTPPPPFDFNVRFPGQYYDAESGLHYNRFRTYDPSTGRYISADPIGQYGIQFDQFLPRQTAERRAQSLMANLSPSEAALQLNDINQLLVDAGLQGNAGLPFASLARHQYGYASFDPINSLDPLGLAPPSDEAKTFFKRGAKANKAGNPLGRQFCKTGLEVCLKDAADDGPDADRCKELFTCAEPPFFLPPGSCPNVGGTLDDLRNRLRQNQSNQ